MDADRRGEQAEVRDLPGPFEQRAGENDGQHKSAGGPGGPPRGRANLARIDAPREIQRAQTRLGRLQHERAKGRVRCAPHLDVDGGDDRVIQIGTPLLNEPRNLPIVRTRAQRPGEDRQRDEHEDDRERSQREGGAIGWRNPPLRAGRGRCDQRDDDERPRRDAQRLQCEPPPADRLQRLGQGHARDPTNASTTSAPSMSISP